MSARALACGLLLSAAALYCALAMEVHAGLEFFLPQSEGAAEAADTIRALSQAPVSRRIVLSVEAPDTESAVAAWHGMAEALRDAPADLLSTGIAETLGTALFEHREGFISERPEDEIPAMLTPEGIARRIHALKSKLGGPMGAVIRATAPADPLQFFDLHTARMLAMDEDSPLQRVQGALLTPAGPPGKPQRHAILILASHHGAFDNVAQRALLSRVQRAFDEVNAAHGGKLRLEMAALARFSLAMERSIRADVQRISVLSSVGIVLLFLLLLGRLRYLALGLLPLAAAFVTGTAACLLLNGRIHAMTFAFGSALVGVCIDYPIHLFTHHVDGALSAPTDRRELRRALGLGCLTTVVGLSGMGFAGLPGIREVALFGATGVLAALAVTLWVLPAWLPAPAPRAPRMRAVAFATGLLGGLGRRRVASAIVVVGVAVAAVAGAGRLRFRDDPQALTSTSPSLRAEDQRVRERAFGAALGGGGQLAIAAPGDSREQAMAHNDALALVLHAAREDGLLDGYRSLHGLLWSETLQRRNLAQVTAHLDTDAVASALQAEGFVAAGFAPFFDKHAPGAAPAEPLASEGLPDAIERGLIAPWFIQRATGPAVLTPLSGVRDWDALQRRVASLPGARLVDVARARTSAYADFRRRTLALTALGLVAVLLVMAVRYRDPRRTAAAFLPAGLAATGCLGLLGLLGVQVNLMHIMGLLLVLSMGADYGVFLVEHGGDDGDRGPTYLAICMACVSTSLSFGLLSLSTVPALRSVGQSVAIGVVLALVLAPAIRGILLPDASASADAT